MARRRQYDRIRRAVRICVSAQRRFVAAHRTALRVESHTPPVRSQPQRAYNEVDGPPTGVERGNCLEWRRVWAGRRRPDHDRGGGSGAVCLESADPHSAVRGIAMRAWISLIVLIAVPALNAPTLKAEDKLG